jgi:hypothetical protein
MIVCYLDLQLPVQSVPITTKVVSSNPVHGKVYSILHNVIKFVRLYASRFDDMYACGTLMFNNRNESVLPELLKILQFVIQNNVMQNQTF